jgi:hypothetical protein
MARPMISYGKAEVARLARQHADYERVGHGIHFGGAHTHFVEYLNFSSPTSEETGHLYRKSA